MTTKLTDTTFEITYRDDYRDSDNYHRILHNSGRALQARELTQAQTIIQNEIRRFGSNIFKEGGKVNNGNISINNLEYIKLIDGELSEDNNTYIGKKYTSTEGIKVKILKVVKEAGDPDTIYVEYLDTAAGDAGNNPIFVTNGTTLTPEDSSLSPIIVAASDATGQGLEASINSGDFFVQGHFVFVKQQSIFLSKYTVNPTKDLGFRIEQNIITENDDEKLLDNQGDEPNRAAAGAHRYQIRLILTTRDEIEDDDNFVFLSKIISGKQGEQVIADNSYNVIQDTLARRTKEESGDYIVKPFRVEFEDHEDSNFLKLKVSDGIAYVDGYRVSIPYKEIEVPKAQTATTLKGIKVSVNYGNYVLFNHIQGTSIPDLHTKLLLLPETSNNPIGTARIRLYEENPGDSYMRAYLYDIQMKEGQNFSNTFQIGTLTPVNKRIRNFPYVNMNLHKTSDNTLLFPFSNGETRPSNINYTSSNSIVIQKKYTFRTKWFWFYSWW